MRTQTHLPVPMKARQRQQDQNPGFSENEAQPRSRSLLQSFTSWLPSIVLHPVTKHARDPDPEPLIQPHTIPSSTMGSAPQIAPLTAEEVVFESPVTIAPDVSFTPSSPSSPRRMPPPVPTSFWNEQASVRRKPSPRATAPVESEPHQSLDQHRQSSFPLRSSAQPVPYQAQPAQPQARRPVPAALKPQIPPEHRRQPSLSAQLSPDFPPGNERPLHLRKSSSSTHINFSRPQSQSPSRRVSPDIPVRARASSMAPPLSPDPDNLPRRTSPGNSRRSSFQGEGEDMERQSRSRRRSWGIGGKRSSRNISGDRGYQSTAQAWLNVAGHMTDYALSSLLAAEKIPELWDENGNIFVYLFPKSTNCGPSFRVSSEALSSSPRLVSLIHGSVYSGRSRARSFDGRATLTVDDATRNLAVRGLASPPATPQISPPGSDSQSNSDGTAESVRSLSDAPKEVHLYFPVGMDPKVTPGCNVFSADDIQRLIDTRNLFAFLTTKPLVFTPRSPNIYQTLLSMSHLLRQYEFSNFDGSTFGEVASSSFNSYVEEFELHDLSRSREKTIEALILGERMRSAELYNQAFVHAVGKCEAVTAMQSHLFEMVSRTTRNRLQRAHIDLLGRLREVESRLTDFDFPSLWAGIAASTSLPEVKSVRFKAWKSSFGSMRKHVISYYKDLYGSWPPKASSKRNSFMESGLNRVVLQQLYSDFCHVYDLLADRTSLTDRHYDAVSDEMNMSNPDRDVAALRKLLSEWDRSSPPVQPPVPFDVPIVPTIATILPEYSSLSLKDKQKVSSRKLRSDEYRAIMRAAQNTADCDFTNPFVANFKAFEEREGKGKTAQELADHRYGYWIFLYVVIESLPMVVVDAPGLRFSDGVEYFLCEPPIGNVPWLENSAAINRSWYGVQGGTGVVSLPSDVVNYSVEGIYHRSHCWMVAEKWLSTQERGPHSYIPTDRVELPASDVIHPSTQSSLETVSEESPREPSERTNTETRSSLETHTRKVSVPLIPPVPVSEEPLDSRFRKRQSIALGLEQLPIPVNPSSEWPPRLPTEKAQPRSRGSSPAAQRFVTGGDRRTSGQLLVPEDVNSLGIPVPPVPQDGGATFEDILGEDDESHKRSRSRSRSRRKSWFAELRS